MWRSEDRSWELVLSLGHVTFRDQTQAIGYGVFICWPLWSQLFYTISICVFSPLSVSIRKSPRWVWIKMILYLAVLVSRSLIILVPVKASWWVTSLTAACVRQTWGGSGAKTAPFRELRTNALCATSTTRFQAWYHSLWSRALLEVPLPHQALYS